MFEVGDRVVLQVATPGRFRSVETWPASIVKVTPDTVLVQYWDEYYDEYGDEHEVLKTLEVFNNDPNVRLTRSAVADIRCN